MYILHPSDGTVSRLYRAHEDHSNHGGNVPRGISAPIKVIILQLFKDGIRKPKEIMRVLEEKGEKVPSKSQLGNHLVYVRKIVLGDTTISFGELEAWAKSKELIPEDPDIPFATSFEGSANLGDDSNYFRLALTTSRLASIAGKSKLVQSDATYKLVYQGFPILITGTTDAARKFHPSVLAVTTTETEGDFSFLFLALSGAVQKTTGKLFEPDILVADAAAAITNGFTASFGKEPRRVHCWFHVIHNVDKKLFIIRDVERRKEMRQDIVQLQTCTDESQFSCGVNLFETKWENEEPDFLNYFKANWLNHNRNWYEGFSLKTPSTNNGIEAVNRTLKKENTLRERLPLSRFLTVAENIVRSWSKSRDPSDPNHLPFSTDPNPGLPLWTAAFHWASMKIDIMQDIGEESTFYVRPTAATSRSKLSSLVSKKKKMDERKNWTSLEEFFQSKNSVWKITGMTKESYLQAVCTCEGWLKKDICKHTLGLAVGLKFCEVPHAAKDIPIGQKRKRGRPSKAKRALIRQ